MGLFSKAPDARELEDLRKAWVLIDRAVKKAEAAHCCSKFSIIADAAAECRKIINGDGK